MPFASHFHSTARLIQSHALFASKSPSKCPSFLFLPDIFILLGIDFMISSTLYVPPPSPPLPPQGRYAPYWKRDGRWDRYPKSVHLYLALMPFFLITICSLRPVLGLGSCVGRLISMCSFALPSRSSM